MSQRQLQHSGAGGQTCLQPGQERALGLGTHEAGRQLRRENRHKSHGTSEWAG